MDEKRQNPPTNIRPKRFLWRSSNLKALMKCDYLVINRTLAIHMLWEVWERAYWLPSWSIDGATSVEADLYNAGIANGQYSVVVVLYAFATHPDAQAAYGGGTYGVDFPFLGDAAYIGIPIPPSLELAPVITHEYWHFNCRTSPGSGK